MASRRKPAVSDELLDQLLEGTDALEAFQSGDLVQDLKKALAERILNAELDHHLDHEEEQVSGNHRNGHNRKRMLTDYAVKLSSRWGSLHLASESKNPGRRHE